MTSENNQLAVQQPAPLASSQLASFLGIEKDMMLLTLKAQCFKGMRPEQVTDAQLAAFVSTANALQVNPILPGFLYAYPERNGGITPILGPDGVLKKLDELISGGKLEGYECVVYPEDVALKPTHATATIYRQGSTKPAVYTAIFTEWVVGQSPTWSAKPRHMLWIRALKQCARQVIHGLPMDADEYKLSQMLNVTESDEATSPATVVEPKQERAPVRERAKKGAAAIQENPKEIVTEVQNVTPPDIQQQMQAREEKLVKPVETEVAKPADQPPAKEQASAGVESRAFLKPDEKITAQVEVVSSEALIANKAGQPIPSVEASVKGGFTGTILHIGGAEGNPPVLPAHWKAGSKIEVVLFGRALKSGKVRPEVESVKLAAKVVEE